MTTMFSGLVGAIMGPLLGIIDKAVPDADEAAKIKSELQAMALNGQMKELEAAVSVVIAEAQGNWLQRSWRPLLMVLFGVIIANNYLVVPLLGTPHANIPPDMWALLKLGIGGYVVGRSVEKGIKLWKKG